MLIYRMINLMLLFFTPLGVLGSGIAGSFPACPTQDSRNCYWDAGGMSFISIGAVLIDRDGIWLHIN